MLRNTDKEIFDFLEKIRIDQESTIDLRTDTSYLSKSAIESLNNNLLNISEDNQKFYINKLYKIAWERINKLFNVNDSFPALGKYDDAINYFKEIFTSITINKDNYELLDSDLSEYELIIIEASFFINHNLEDLLPLKDEIRKILIDITTLIPYIFLNNINVFDYGNYFIMRTNGFLLSIDDTILLTKHPLPFYYKINPINLLIQTINVQEIDNDNYKLYLNNLVNNTNILKDKFINNNYKIIFNENIPLIYVSTESKMSQMALDEIGIAVSIKEGYYVISLAAITERGLGKHEVEEIFRLIDQANENKDNKEKLQNLKLEVKSLIRKFPLKK